MSQISQRHVYQEAVALLHTEVKDAMDRLIALTDGQRALSEDMMIAQVKDTAEAIHERYPDGPFTRDDLVLLLQTEWERLTTRYMVRGQCGNSLFQREPRTAYQCYSTRCPFCGSSNRLEVVQVTLTYHGDRILEVAAPLSDDGFDFYDSVPVRLRYTDLSTDDEVVECDVCDHRFELSVLVLEDEVDQSSSVASPSASSVDAPFLVEEDTASDS